MTEQAVTFTSAGLKLSGYCRGGLFPASGDHVAAARDDNRCAVDEAAALGAPFSGPAWMVRACTRQ